MAVLRQPGQQRRYGAQARSPAWLILELGGSQFWVGAATGLRVIPFVLASLLAGVLIDRVGGRTMLLWDRLGLLLFACLTAVLILTDSVKVIHLVALSIATGGVAALGIPASKTLVVELVSTERLQTANSLDQFTFSIARALGPMGGGLLIGIIGLMAPWVALVSIYTLAVMAHLPDEPGDATGLNRWRSQIGLWTARLTSSSSSSRTTTSRRRFTVRRGVVAWLARSGFTRLALAVTPQSSLTPAFQVPSSD